MMALELGAAAEDEQLGRARQRIAELERLASRAADALEIAISHYGTEYEQHLIAELREAAK